MWRYRWFQWHQVCLLGRVRLGSIQNKNNWNNASKRLFGSYSHSGIPGFPFRLFCSQEQNSRNIFRNIFLFRNIPNERTLKLYLNSSMYHRNIFGSSSKVFSDLRKFSDIFGHLRKFSFIFSENVRKRSSGLQNNFEKPSEIFGKWSEIFGKLSKTPLSVRLYIKENITR